MTKTIGIISYLPDNESIRNKRIQKLNNLLSKLNLLFPNIQIVIVAQNWKNYLPTNNNIWIAINSPTPLGITGARIALRKIFLENCNTDYLIMLDDDCEISGSNGSFYLKQIDDNPGCFIEFNKTLLKLFAIDKSLFSQVNFDENISPEDGNGFEDRVFVNKLRKLFPDKRREFKNTGIVERSISTKDPLSTWYKNQNLKNMLNNTSLIIDKICQ